MSQPLTVEIVLCRPKPGVDDATFLAANAAATPVLSAMPGYIRRELLKAADGQWMDMVYWRSLAEAQQAAAAFMQLPSAAALMEVFDTAALTMLHFEQASTFDTVAS